MYNMVILCWICDKIFFDCVCFKFFSYRMLYLEIFEFVGYCLIDMIVVRNRVWWFIGSYIVI